MTIPHSPSNNRDTAAFTAILIGLTALVLFLSDGGVLFTRPFWVDEWLAVFVANRSSPSAVVGDLTAGADGGAPLLHLTLWTLRRLGADLDPWIVRALALSSVLLALIAVFIVLRRRFPFGAAVAGVLAVGAHPLIVWHSYDGRFYGPWLLCASLVALGLARRQDASDAPRADAGVAAGPEVAISRRRVGNGALFLAVAAFLLCGVHPYGIVSLGLLVPGAIAAYRGRWRQGLRDAAPALAGLLAVALLAPIALGQRDAYTVPTWLGDFRLRQLTLLSKELWIGSVPLLAVALLAVSAVVRVARGEKRSLDGARAPTRDAGVLALLALALMPLALAVISLLGQPSMLQRYGIVTALAWAPLVAWAGLMAGRWASGLACLALAWLWFGAYVRETNAKAAFGRMVAREQQTYEQARRTGLPVVVQSMHVLYSLIGSAPRESPAFFLVLPDSAFASLWDDTTPMGQANRGLVLERDLARVHSTRWRFPKLITPRALDTTHRFLLIAPEGRRPVGFASIQEYASKVFPQHRIKRLIPDLFLLERSAVGVSSD